MLQYNCAEAMITTSQKQNFVTTLMIISKELGVNFQTSKNDIGNRKVLQKLKIIYEEIYEEIIKMVQIETIFHRGNLIM